MFTELTGDLARIIPDNSSDSLKTIGFYYDDPLETRESRLRYVVGVIFPEEGQEEWTGDKITSLRDGLLAKEYKLTTLPKIDHVVYTTFPFRSSLSIVIAVKRVYPIIRAYISRHNLCAHPALEVYTPDLIYFILPLSKQDHFYLFDSDDEEEEEEEVEADNIPFSSGSETDAEVSDVEAGTNSEEDLDRDLKTKGKEGRSKKSNTNTSLRHRGTGVRKSSQTSTQNSSSSFEEITVSEKDK